MTNPHSPNGLDKLQRVIVIIVALPLCGCLLCAANTFAPIIIQEIKGQFGLHLYGNAHYLYDLQLGYGSGNRGDRILYYWTQNPLEQVKQHYGRYFSLEVKRDGLWSEGYSNPVTIYLIDANRENLDALTREWVFPYSSQLRGSVEALRFLSSVQPGGTVIIYKYEVDFWD
jgi:hypothetical protein